MRADAGQRRWMGIAVWGVVASCGTAPEPARDFVPPPRFVEATPPGEASRAELDRLLESSWRQTGVTPAPPADDGEFLRRVSLDLVGRIPTLAEAKAFLADVGADKRARAVDRLLDGPELADHW